MADPDPVFAKQDRLDYQYYWTCGPAFLHYFFEADKTIEVFTYVDSGIFFFANATALLDELWSGETLLYEHRQAQAPDDTRGLDDRFKVGMVLFKRTPSTRACIKRWRVQRIEWCFDRHEIGRCGGQAYLNEWPALFKNVVVARRRPRVSVAEGFKVRG